MSADSPLVSVIMAAYNSEAYIEEAILSILGQSFSDWELLIVDDASEDRTAEIAKVFEEKDDRIKLLSQATNSGVVSSRNLGLQTSKGKYIAILDSDDIAYPNRLEVQLNILEKDKNLMLIGGACHEIDSEGRPLNKIERIIPNEQLSTLLLFSNYFINSTVMFRKIALEDQWYQEGFQPSEDYELFCRLAEKGRLANLNSPLVYYRIHDQNISGNSEKLLAAVNKVQRNILKKLGIVATEIDLELHAKLTEGPFPTTLEQLQNVEVWLRKIRTQNETSKLYAKDILDELINLFFMRSCEHSGLGLKAIRFYYQSILSGGLWAKPIGNLIFIFKTLYRSNGKA